MSTGSILCDPWRPNGRVGPRARITDGPNYFLLDLFSPPRSSSTADYLFCCCFLFILKNILTSARYIALLLSRRLVVWLICVYSFAHGMDGAGGTMFSGCPSICACVRACLLSRAEAFTDRLDVDF